MILLTFIVMYVIFDAIKLPQGGIIMGFFKNLKEGMAAQKKLVDAINNGDLVVDRKNMTITPTGQNQNNEEKKQKKTKIRNNE